ncbi:MAG: glutaredoxin [Bacillota bacterium]|nr:glutaredoxin [Bacillota bacterium]
MKKFLFFFLLLVFVMQAKVCSVWAENNDKVIAVYFFSPTCASCSNMTYFLERFCEKHKNLDLKKYDISDLRNKSLMDKYCEVYKVSAEDEGIVPIIFIRDKYFSDEKSIMINLEKEINYPGVKTIEIHNAIENHDKDLRRFKGFEVISVLMAGLINGINPCSMSMLLFFLSLLTVKSIKILKVGFLFILGKFLAYVLLGTILFKFLSLFNLSFLNVLMKALLAIVTLILIILNIQDFFAAKVERYDRIILQLPKVFRKLNHNIIKRASGFANIKILLFISFFLGMIISLGEFLCTGQIYLATIITIIHTNLQLSVQALIYLIIYNLGLISPLILLTFIVYKGKEIFDVSEAIRERLHYIKLVNAIIFCLFGVILFFFF